jgi:hypothetical protein
MWQVRLSEVWGSYDNLCEDTLFWDTMPCSQFVRAIILGELATSAFMQKFETAGVSNKLVKTCYMAWSQKILILS